MKKKKCILLIAGVLFWAIGLLSISTSCNNDDGDRYKIWEFIVDDWAARKTYNGAEHYAYRSLPGATQKMFDRGGSVYHMFNRTYKARLPYSKTYVQGGVPYVETISYYVGHSEERGFFIRFKLEASDAGLYAVQPPAMPFKVIATW